MTGVAIIDQNTLDRLLESIGGDREFLGDLLDTFLADSPRLIAACQAALATNDTEDLRRAAHTLKSNSASLGALALSVECRQLEMMGKAGDLNAAAEQLGRVIAEYERARAALEQVRHTIRP